MVLRTTTYNILAVQELIEHDRELGRGERQLAVESLVLHHGDRQWNAPTRLRDLFRDSAPDTCRVVERLPPDAPPPGPLDLPQMLLGLLRSKWFDTDQLKEAMTMGAVETEFRRGWDDVRRQGIGVGQVRIPSQQAARKFGRETAEQLARLLGRNPDGERINRVAAAILDCDAPDDFLARVRGR